MSGLAGAVEYELTDPVFAEEAIPQADGIARGARHLQRTVLRGSNVSLFEADDRASSRAHARAMTGQPSGG